MKRRDFLKNERGGRRPDGLAADARRCSPQPKTILQQHPAATPSSDNRPAEYLRRVQGDPFLPKPPAPARTYPISPMPLAERVRRKIVPQRGFCSTAPGNLVSDSSHFRQWRHEHRADGRSLRGTNPLPPRKPAHAVEAALEAPKVADIFPQVRQLVLDGKTPRSPGARRRSA